MKGLLWMKRVMAVIIKHMFTIVLCIGIIVVVLAYIVRFELHKETKEEETILLTASTLTKTIEIAELSTAEFRYRGIAEVYSEKNKSELVCRICYNAIIKAGIDMNQVRFDIDTEEKIVTATLPDIDIIVNIVDEQSIALLPADADIEISSMIQRSREDAENEARESSELISVAEDNLKSTIIGLLTPILDSQKYSLIWN